MRTRADEMLQMLDSPNPALRARAILMLGHEQHMLPLDQLRQIYDEGDAGVHIAVLKYLNRNLPPGHHEIVLKALTDSANSVRLEAVEYLIKYPNASAAQILEALLNDPDFPHRGRVIAALAACDDGYALEVLVTLLEDPSIPERRYAGSMLSTHDVHPILDRLLRLLDSDDELTVRAAISALSRVKDDFIIEHLLTVIDKWRAVSKSQIVYEAVGLLDKFRDARIRDTLLRLLSTNEPVLGAYREFGRSTAIHMLGNYPEPQVIQHLLELLQRGSQSDRNAALYGFTNIGTVEIVDLLLTTCLTETDPLTLANYSAAFVRLGDKRAVPTLEALLERVTPLHRSIVESNLRSLNPPPPKPIRTTLFTKIKTRLRPNH